MHRRKWMFLVAPLLIIPLACSFGSGIENRQAPGAPQGSGAPGAPQGSGAPASYERVEAEIEAAQGGLVKLDDGARVVIPPGALAASGRVSIQPVAPAQAPDGYVLNLGKVYEIDLGADALQKEALLSLPVDRTQLPPGVSPEEVFLSYWDAAAGEWVYAGGSYDEQSGLVSLAVEHASLWKPATWNVQAWIAFLNSMLSGSVVEMVQGVQLLVEDCPQVGGVSRVLSNQATVFLQGCVRRDDTYNPELLIINPKSFYFEVMPVAGGGGYPPQTLLGPGESLRFVANTRDASPLVVAGVITPRSTRYLLAHLVLTMLPGFQYAPNQGEISACVTENLSLSAPFISAAELLAHEKDGARAAEEIVQFLRDPQAAAQLSGAAGKCGLQAAPSWRGVIKQLAASTSTIMSATDVWANFLLTQGVSEIEFHWPHPAAGALPTSTAPPGVPPTPFSPVAIDLKDPYAVLGWFLKAIERRSFTGIETFLAYEDMGLTNNPIEGGQTITSQQFLVDLHLRAANSRSLACTALHLEQGYLNIWTEGWTPAWEMTEFCYGGCQPINPPHRTSNAIFSFGTDREGKYFLRILALHDGGTKEWDPLGMAPYYPCDADRLKQILTNPARSCQPGLPPRLMVGAYAFVSENPPVPNRVREKPGLPEKYLGQIMPGKTMEVVAGPVCADNLAWWQVAETGTGLKGWTVEGDDGSYWLVPCPSKELCK